MTVIPAVNPRRFFLLALMTFIASGAIGFATGRDAVARLQKADLASPDEAIEMKTDLKEAPVLDSPQDDAARFVPLGQFVVPVLNAGHTMAFVLTDIVLSVDTGEHAYAVTSLVPRYRDAIFQALFSEGVAGTFEAPNFSPASLGMRLVQALAQSIPENPVEKVLFNQLLLQDNRAG